MSYLDDWNIEQRRAAARWRRKNTRLRAVLARIKVSATSPNGQVGVTVDAHGKIVDIRLSAQAMRLGHSQLGRLLLETIERAQADTARQAKAAAQPYIGDPAAMKAVSLIRELLSEKGATGSTSAKGDSEAGGPENGSIIGT